ncbi:integrin alpha-4-like, partial [Argonauta hians]
GFNNNTEGVMAFQLDIYHFLCYLLIIPPVITFNLDTKGPVVIDGTLDTYFGYSVGLYSDSNQTRILVGAPRQPLITRKNSFFSCEINRNHCDEISLPRPAYAGNSNPWIGVAVDTNPEIDNSIIVCSHRFQTDHQDSHGSYNLQSGTCYEKKGRSFVQTILVRTMATAGISVRYLPNGRSVLIGTPTSGTKYLGGYILKPLQKIEKDPIEINEGNHSYVGYAVDMANNKIVLGIPRHNETGAIRVEDQLITAPTNKYTFGSYFGSVLAVGDINSDKKEDVIVGAPLYSEKYPEEGRVYIFFTEKNGRMSSVPNQILSIPSYRARFGAAIAVSDLDSNNYTDILVGAPYENGGSGCIYIFNSFKGKLETIPSQKIEGIKLISNMKSFGMSFSRFMDVDGNGFPDVVVGAYLSDKVILMKTRPVITVSTHLQAQPRTLPSFLEPVWQRNEDIIVNITIYLYFATRHQLVVQMNLKTDVEQPASRKRVYFENNENEITENQIVKGYFYSKTYGVKIKNKINMLDPIKFSFEYSLPNNGYNPWCTLCPLLKSGNLSTKVKFNVSCGSDEICETHFNILLSNPSKLLLSGERKYIKIDAWVENVREHAYNTMAHIQFPSWLEYVTVKKYNSSDNNITCSLRNSQQKLSCFLGHPMKEESHTSFMITFLAHWMPIPEDLNISMSVTTDSVIPPEYQNQTFYNLTIPVRKKSMLKLFGISESDLHVHKGRSKRPVIISQLYMIENTGPSEAQNIVFQLSVPQLIMRNMTMMSLDSLQYEGAQDTNSSDVCSTVTTDYSENNLHTIHTFVLRSTSYDCSWMKCVNITCHIKHLKKHRSMKISFDIKVTNTYLDILKGKVQNINIKTTGTLKQQWNKHILKVPGTVTKTITSGIHIPPVKPTIKWWILVTSILSGILLMVLVSFLLYEIGFFNRYKKMEEEGESLNQEENKEDETNNKDEKEEKKNGNAKVNNYRENEDD